MCGWESVQRDAMVNETRIHDSRDTELGTT